MLVDYRSTVRSLRPLLMHKRRVCMSYGREHIWYWVDTIDRPQQLPM